ncbi:hypothetical protein [Geomonas propionica]|nr:hypothetical protein [Geomonas propionica]
MKITRRTRVCCVAVIVAGVAVVGHVVAKDRGLTSYHQGVTQAEH